MPNRSLEVVVLCPTGRDAQLITEFLISETIPAKVIGDIKEFCHQDQSGAGALIVADEALSTEAIDALNDVLAMQEPWSDIPIILLVSGGPRRRPAVEGLEIFVSSGNVSLLERPLQPTSLLSTTKVALRARRRQFQVKDLLTSQVEATKMRDEFISIASHELKTPLTSLKLQTQMSKRQLVQLQDYPKEKIVAHLDSTIKQIERLNKLVDDMLDITRISTGRLKLLKGNCDLSKLVMELIDRFSPQFAAVNISVKANVTQNISGHWDTFKLEQVINNLFSNTIRYAPGAPVQVTLMNEKQKVRLTVADSGPGIEEQSLERIFERFERSTESRAGLGLGLYITKQIIDLHNGSIWAESKLGKGTTFVVELPLK